MRVNYGGIWRDFEEEAAEERAKAARLAAVLDRAHEIETMRMCCRYELESDEFQTREEKAEVILGTQRRRARR